MDILCPTKSIKKLHFCGKLLIDGDLEDNCILFRFLFDKAEMVHPLLIWVKVRPIEALGNRSGRVYNEKKIFVFKCNIPDCNNPLMKSSLLFPNFLLREYEIRVINIESQISYHFCDIHESQRP